MNLILLCFQQLWNFKNFERLYLKTSIMTLEYFFHYSLQLLMQLMDDDLWDLDKLQTCAKGKSILEFRSVSMGIRKCKKKKKNCNRAKKYQKMVCPSRHREYVFIRLV